MFERDTIAALATPPGPGAVGIIRLSGSGATAIATAIFRGRAPATWPSHTLMRGSFLSAEGRAIDDGLAVIMRAPHSYTGEDCLELHCHGSPVVLREVLGRVLALGARPAEPGEFTKRAFLNGKLDLAQAEAVMDLVRCRTPTAATLAADHLAGALSRHLGDLRQRLIAVKGHLEALIDFSDEDIEVDAEAVAGEVGKLRDSVRELLATHHRGQLYRDGLRVAISGRPNVGKSSLLNALARSERAIVTEMPGTTRDVIEETVDIGGVPVVLADTAGLRPAADAAEQIGIARARDSGAAADVVLLVLDGSVAFAEPPILPRESQRALVVINKCDLAAAWQPTATLRQIGEVIRVSARTGDGIADLEKAISGAATPLWSDAVPPLTTLRQRDAVAKVAASLDAAASAAAAGAPADIVAVDVQLALDHLAAVTGEILDEDVLDVVFREFCIGK